MTRFNWFAPVFALCLTLSAVPDRAQAQGGDLSKGIKDMSVKAGTADFRDITIGTPATGSVSIGKISFVGFVREGDKVRADRVEVEKLTGKVGERTIEVPAITVIAFEGPVELFRALTEGGNANYDWIALLQKAAASQITVDRVLDHNPALFFESVINTVSISNVKDGIIGTAQFAGMEGKSNAAGVGPTSLKLGSLRYQGINVSESMRLLSGGGTGDAKRLLERATLDGMEVATPEGSFKFAHIEMSGIDARAPSVVLDPSDRAALQSGAAFEDPQRRQRLAKYFGELIRYMRVERYSLEGFSVATPQGTVSIKAFTFAGLGGRGLDLFEIRDMDVPTPTGPVRLGRFAIEKLTYGALLDAVFDAVAAGKEPDFNDPAKILAIAPRLAAIRLAAIQLTTPDGPASLGGFEIEMDDKVGAIPERVAAAIKQLKVQIDKATTDEGRKTLLALGYSDLTADAQAQLRWAKNDKTLILENTNLLLDKVGRVDLSARLGNVDLASAIANPAQFAPDAAKLESLEIRVKNLGAAERFYALTAKGAGISQDAVRDGLAAEVKARAGAILGSALTPGSADALAKFLKTPGTLVVRAVPKPGKTLTIGEASTMDPPAILERLQITLEASN
jgi:hypothetical protein